MLLTINGTNSDLHLHASVTPKNETNTLYSLYQHKQLFHISARLYIFTKVSHLPSVLLIGATAENYGSARTAGRGQLCSK